MTGKEDHHMTGKDDHHRTGKDDHHRTGKDDHHRIGKNELHRITSDGGTLYPCSDVWAISKSDPKLVWKKIVIAE